MSDYPAKPGYEPSNLEAENRELLNAVMGELNMARRVIGLSELTQISVSEQTSFLVDHVIPGIDTIITDRLAITKNPELAQKLAQAWGTYALPWPGGSGGEQMVLMSRNLLKFYGALRNQTFKPVSLVATGSAEIETIPRLEAMTQSTEKETEDSTLTFQGEVILVQEFKEVKDDIEALKIGLAGVCHSLKTVVDNLNRQGSEGRALAQGLFLEETLNYLSAEDSYGPDFKKILETGNVSAPNFVRAIFGHRTFGQMNRLGKAYARIKAFYPGDNRFKAFTSNFENFIQIVNHNNTEYNIPEIPKLLTLMDENTQVLDVYGDVVEKPYNELPVAKRAVKAALDAKTDKRYLIVDVTNMPLQNIKTGVYSKSKVIIGTNAAWG